MRTLFAFIMTSRDGLTAGADGDLSWHHVDQEFSEFCSRQLHEADTLLMGRTTFEGMEEHWSTAHARRTDPVIAETMNSMRKIVASRTRDETQWAHVEFMNESVAEHIRDHKSRPGRSIALLGSSELTAHLLTAGLVDELRIMVNPVVVGSGPTLLQTLPTTPLRLQKVRQFKSGNTLLTCLP